MNLLSIDDVGDVGAAAQMRTPTRLGMNPWDFLAKRAERYARLSALAPGAQPVARAG